MHGATMRIINVADLVEPVPPRRQNIYLLLLLCSDFSFHKKLWLLIMCAYVPSSRFVILFIGRRERTKFPNPPDPKFSVVKCD